MLTLQTHRLDLIAATVELLDAELDSCERLASLLDALVPSGWPPGEYDRSATEFFRDRLLKEPAALGWLGWYAILRATQGAPATLVGSGGYFGPPDQQGSVEIGYSILPAFEGRGFATEIAQALVEHAFAAPGVRRIIAHTRPENIGSIKVLDRCGFVPAGPGNEAGTVRYTQDRASA